MYFQLQRCYGIPLFVSFKPTRLAQTYVIQIYTRTPPEVDFESVKFPAKSASCKNPSLLFSVSIFNATILSVVGCVMNVADETCELKIACSVPLCD